MDENNTNVKQDSLQDRKYMKPPLWRGPMLHLLNALLCAILLVLLAIQHLGLQKSLWPDSSAPRQPQAVVWAIPPSAEWLAEERLSIQQHLSITEPESCDPVSVVSLLTTPNVIWVGTSEEGLFSYHRAKRVWRAHADQGPRGHVHDIRQDGSRVYVDSMVIGNHAYSYEFYTDNDGGHWTRFMAGSDYSNMVHAPEFTNRGMRSPLLQEIVDELRQEGPVAKTHVNQQVCVEHDIVFGTYVNVECGWLACYHYNTSTDILTDLAISEHDTGAVGAREFYLDPYDSRFIWILTAGYGGAIQSPRCWLRYDRTTRTMFDTGISYHELDEFLDRRSGEYLDLITFTPDRVHFLGRQSQEDALAPMASYDRASEHICGGWQYTALLIVLGMVVLAEAVTGGVGIKLVAMLCFTVIWFWPRRSREDRGQGELPPPHSGH